MQVLLSLAGITLLFLMSCSEATTPKVIVQTTSESSASGVNTESSSTAVVTDSTSCPDGDCISNEEKESQVLAAPSNFQVSQNIGGAIVMTWEDTPNPQKAITGYAIQRNLNFEGWIHLAEVTPGKGFFKDTTIGSSVELKFQYRIAGFASNRDSLVTKYTTPTGNTAISDKGFLETEYDAPSDFIVHRWGPTTFEFVWGHSGLKTELGFVVERLNGYKDSIPLVNGEEDQTKDYNNTQTDFEVIVGDWLDLDTLGPTDNHFWVFDECGSNYRVHAYYSDQYANIISEFSPEVTAGPSTPYSEPIVFEAPSNLKVRANVDELTLGFSWDNTHRNCCDYLIVNRIFDFQDIGFDTIPAYQSYYFWGDDALFTDLEELKKAAIQISVLWNSPHQPACYDQTPWSQKAGTTEDLKATIANPLDLGYSDE